MTFLGLENLFYLKKNYSKIITKTKANLIATPKTLTLELVFFKLHITLIKIKLRHICVFSTQKLMKSKKI